MIAQIEIQLFYIIFSGLLFLLPLAVYLATSEMHDSQVYLWCLGFLGIAVGNLFVGLRGQVPMFISFEIAQISMTAGSFLRAMSLRMELTQCRTELIKQAKLYILPLSAYLIVFTLMVRQDVPESYRLILVTLFHLAISLDLFQICRRIKAKLQTHAAKMIALMAVLIVIAMVSRVLGLTTGIGAEGVFGRGADQTLAFVLISVAVLLGNFGFVQLRLAKIIKKEEQTRLELSATNEEKNRIADLLQEKEALISSLLKANKTVTTGALSASIAHELNQPLGANNLNIQFLQQKLSAGELSASLGAEVLASLQNDNNRAAEIIKSLRSIFLERKTESEESDLKEIIGDILVVTRPELNRHGIALKLDLSDCKMVPTNRGEVQQVILNLMNNAIQALGTSDQTDKSITLKSTTSANGIQLSISDNGPGVSEQLHHDLFGLLNTTKSNGMGLGLWLCKHIVTRNGGRLWFETAEGGGANFIMELPAQSQWDAPADIS